MSIHDEFRVVEARTEGFCILTKNERVVVGSEDEYGHYGPIKNVDDARRIVACVNACAGWTTEQLEAMEIGSMKETISRLAGSSYDAATWEARATKEASRASDLQAQVDELLAALHAAIECGMVPTSSAREGGAMAYVRQAHVADQIRDVIKKITGEPK